VIFLKYIRTEKNGLKSSVLARQVFMFYDLYVHVLDSEQTEVWFGLVYGV